MKVDVYNLKNEVVGSMDLPERIFKVRWNPDLVNQARRVLMANKTKPYAHAKGRGEVRGGGRKPWRQKGTGRSRQGSIRSPIWKGGGASHGPVRFENTGRELNQKMRQAAIFSVFSKKLIDGQLKVVESFGVNELKTKTMAAALRSMLGPRPSALLIGSDESRAVKRIASNIPAVDAISPRSVNAYDLLRHGAVIVEKPAVDILDKHFKASV